MDLKTFLDTNSWNKTNNSTFISVSNDGKEFNLRTLNLVQRILRLLGFYTDTHLPIVALGFENAYKNRTWSCLSYSTNKSAQNFEKYLFDKLLKRKHLAILEHYHEKEILGLFNIEQGGSHAYRYHLSDVFSSRAPCMAKLRFHVNGFYNLIEDKSSPVLCSSPYHIEASRTIFHLTNSNFKPTRPLYKHVEEPKKVSKYVQDLIDAGPMHC